MVATLSVPQITLCCVERAWTGLWGESQLIKLRIRASHGKAPNLVRSSARPPVKFYIVGTNESPYAGEIPGAFAGVIFGKVPGEIFGPVLSDKDRSSAYLLPVIQFAQASPQGNLNSDTSFSFQNVFVTAGEHKYGNGHLSATAQVWITETSSLTMATQRKIQSSPANAAWWKEASVYQIYPASFKDSNGDGIGDIPGIISELDYLKALGVDLVWLSPILQSPQVDMGYDVSDYYQIHPPYGTIEDVDALIEGLHQRGMRYVMDLVVNHTSDQHEWFKRSRSSRDDEYRDWYIWKKPRYDANGVRQPPNNWSAYFGGSAWQYDETTGEYYLHLFAPEQPDLNWENPKVRSAVHQIMRYWLDKGVSGFRMDVINMVSKDQSFPDAPVTDTNTPWQHGAMYYCCGPRLHEYLQELGAILKEYDAFSVGEMPNVYDPAEIGKAVGFNRGELAMAFQFEIMDIDHGPAGKFSPHDYRMSDLKQIVTKWQHFMYQNEGWNALYLENHDQGRTISRFTSAGPEDRATAGKMLATFLGLQGGTPFVYQGQEIGMVNVPEAWGIEKFRDIETLNHWDEMKATYPDDMELHKVTLEQFRVKSRDNGRTPMQWTSDKFAGFTTAPNGPWIDVHDDYEDWNAASQVVNPNSVFQHWAKVLSLRKTYKDLFVYGLYKLVDEANNDLFAYLRAYEGQSALVLANFTGKEVSWNVPAEAISILQNGAVLLENYNNHCPILQDGVVAIKPFESFVMFLDCPSARVGTGVGKL